MDCCWEQALSEHLHIFLIAFCAQFFIPSLCVSLSFRTMHNDSASFQLLLNFEYGHVFVGATAWRRKAHHHHRVFHIRSNAITANDEYAQQRHNKEEKTEAKPSKLK